MSNNTTDELVELVRQINFLLTGRYVSVNTTAIQRAILDWHNKQIEAVLDRVEKEITDKVTTTTIQNIHPLKNGHYVRTDNLIKMLDTLRKELDGGRDE